MDNPFIRGSLSGLITCTLVQPLDVIKTSIITINKHFSIRESSHYVHSKYGLSGFWRGLRPAAYKAIMGSGLSFTLFEFLKSLVPESSVGFASNSLVASLSRGSIIALLAPLSIIKVRMEAPQVKGYSNVLEGLSSIYLNEGVRGYYQGLGSCLLRDLPFTGLAYAFYEKFSDIAREAFGMNVWIRTGCGAVAGFCATIVTQPFDVIKTRQQFRNLGQEEDFRYKSTLDALLKIYRKEGIFGYTLGLKIRLVERSTGFTVVWFIYERLRSLTC